MKWRFLIPLKKIIKFFNQLKMIWLLTSTVNFDIIALKIGEIKNVQNIEKKSKSWE